MMSDKAAITLGDANGGPRARVPKVTVIGHILNERVVFPNRVLYPVLGSPAAYSSICLARLGVRVGLVTMLGPDFPAELLARFDEAGIARAGFGTSELSSCNELIYGEDGRKQIRFLSKARPLRYSEVPEDYLAAKLVYACPMDGEVDVEMIRQLRANKSLMIVDLGGFGGATSATHAEKKDGALLAQICPYFDVVKGSIEDLEYILGTTATDYAAAAAALHGWGAKEVVITLGKNGAYVSKDGATKTIPPYRGGASKVVDQTGAGDTFSAGFLCKYLDSRDPFAAAAYGNVVASFVIARTGGASVLRMPSREEADQREREFLGQSEVSAIAG
jgi:sugar/nucleoside kinase (ribokinase family)